MATVKKTLKLDPADFQNIIKEQVDPESAIFFTLGSEKFKLATWKQKEKILDISKWDSHHEMIFSFMEILSKNTLNSESENKARVTLDYLKKHIETIHVKSKNSIVAINYQILNSDTKEVLELKEIATKLKVCFEEECTIIAIQSFLDNAERIKQIYERAAKNIPPTT